MTRRALNPRYQYLDSAGTVLAAGTLTFYDNGTSNLATVYSDVDQLVAQSNPYTLTANGQIDADIFWTGPLRVVVKDSAGATVDTTDDVTPGLESFATAASTILGQKASGGLKALTSAEAGAILAGKQTIPIPAAGMRPSTSNGCAALADLETTSGRPDITSLAFDKDTDEHAMFSFTWPSQWNEGTITYRVHWTTATDVTTNGVAWALQGVAVSDGDTIDTAYGSAVIVTDDNQGVIEEELLTAESAAVTIAGTPAAGDKVFFRVYRDVSDANDDLGEDALLMQIDIFWTQSVINDD